MRAMVSLLPDSRVDTASLKLAHPIAEVVARYGVELKRQGRAMVGRCIFHPDNGRPNLYVYGDSESWRCYRCGIGGDVLAFVMHAEDIGFREAVDRLSGGHHGLCVLRHARHQRRTRARKRRMDAQLTSSLSCRPRRTSITPISWLSHGRWTTWRNV